MKDKLLYKEFIGSVHYASEDSVFYGKIEGINDLVTFEGESVLELKQAFEDAVEDYFELCAELDKSPLKSFKGTFNVRVGPELHAKAYKMALIKGKSLNQFVQVAIEEALTK